MNVYLITGASSDIGCSFIQQLEKKKEKCIVIAQYNTTNIREKIGFDFEYVEMVPFKCDLSKEDQVDLLIEFLNENEYSITHLIHLPAPKFSYMRLKDYDSSVVNNSVNTQVNSLGKIFKSVLPKMKKQKYGKIVLMLTAYTIGTPPKFLTDYIISKYALLGLMKSAAVEYSGCGININALSPNMIETKSLSNIDERIIEITADQCAMKRNVKIDEVVSGIEYLLSDAASYIHGVNLNMTGGDAI